MSKRGNQLTVITLGMILLGGTILGSTPFAFADEDDDKKEKLKDLLEKIKAKIEAKKPPPGGPPGGGGDKCKGDKYGEICDDDDPIVEIKFPKKRSKLPADTYTIEVKAKDKKTGVEMVEVFVNGDSIGKATPVGGDLYEIPFDFFEEGRYTIKAIATDLVGHEGSDKIRFRIV